MRRRNSNSRWLRASRFRISTILLFVPICALSLLAVTQSRQNLELKRKLDAQEQRLLGPGNEMYILRGIHTSDGTLLYEVRADNPPKVGSTLFLPKSESPLERIDRGMIMDALEHQFRFDPRLEVTPQL